MVFIKSGKCKYCHCTKMVKTNAKNAFFEKKDTIVPP